MKNKIVFSLAVTALSLAVGCSREESTLSATSRDTNSVAPTLTGTIPSSPVASPLTNRSNGMPSTLTNAGSRVSTIQEPVLPAAGLSSESLTARAQRIHDSLLADASLAPLANTVYVSNTSGGRVVLAGSVTTEAEKQRVNAIAEGVAGAGNVDNQLEIK